MLKPFSEKQQVTIANNVIKACKDISKLNKAGYEFISGANGFIAHYNISGFIAQYQNWSLADDIMYNSNSNKWSNFREGDQNYAYYMSKKAIYNRIVDGIKKELTYA